MEHSHTNSHAHHIWGRVLPGEFSAKLEVDVRHDVVCFLCSISVGLVVWSSTYCARASPVHVRARR